MVNISREGRDVAVGNVEQGNEEVGVRKSKRDSLRAGLLLNERIGIKSQL